MFRAHPARVWQISNAQQMTTQTGTTPQTAVVFDKSTLPSYSDAVNDTEKYPKEIAIEVPMSNDEFVQYFTEIDLRGAHRPPPGYGPMPTESSTRRGRRRSTWRRVTSTVQEFGTKKIVLAPVILMVLFTIIMIIIALYGQKRKVAMS
ncbi:hypothetical protein L596_020943 [Steinernema carpocapsae]|uniref:Uncharacterized protein n=1 Tax=Steinernema carpocapsae TaxID=34508 RepID=A0A4U5MV79_STECR|nr:hypothetical protein L596_020943 [Steinernema carpocapsae]